jgi:predicted aspartyl protease
MKALDHNRRLMLAGVGAGLFAAALPRHAKAQDAAAPTLPEAEYAEDAPIAEVMSMEDASRRMTVPVMLDGQGPFDFVVDTGTNRSVVSHELAEKLGLAAGPKARVHGITGPGASRTVRVQSLKIGAREARKLNLPAMPARSLGGQGILGVDGLKKQRVVLDFVEPRLVIEPSSDRWRGREAAVVEARRKFGQLTMVDTDLQGKVVAVVIDTGSEATIGNSVLRRMMVRNADDEARLGYVQLVGATGQTAPGEFGLVPHFRLGQLTLNNLRVVYADLHIFDLWDLQKRPAMILGMDVLRYFETVALDFGRNEVRFVMPKTPIVDPASEGRIRRM